MRSLAKSTVVKFSAAAEHKRKGETLYTSEWEIS